MTPSPSTGYSGRNLAKKHGIGSGIRIAAVDAPRGYAALLAPLPPGVTVGSRASRKTDLVHYFVERRSRLGSRIARLNRSLRDDATLWISWPKKSSGRPTDLTEDVLREVILPLGLVDVKVCAVDDTWSGLKFVRRLENRR